ncbi:hypothetical protein CP556_20845 [Natrinema sp. CBA1119]|uniref:DUF6166 domain-containing protein n=1 Tax=Natrinema sp. CBA1119 TaxID=1608465 RepID=UPI000BF5CA5C|nr:DUF6166 domain-containing protein [Natrinema sp. CBA1119]PGF14552.1 hypothetical protein CP556_20845 [Natrinema sp. CBA1119]
MSGISDPHSHVQSRASGDGDVVYVGYRRRGRAIVEKQSDQEQLTPERSLELANHSPSGFEWGYGGSGPAQLALALLLDYTDDEEVALAHYTEFKNEVVSQLDCDSSDECWRLSGSDIEATLLASTDEEVVAIA